jgi:hypothetical protein
MLLGFNVLRFRYFIYGLLMVLAELCLLFSALLFVILALLKLLSFDFAFVFGFVFLAILNWYLFEHFHIINLPYTYEVYNLLSKIFYSLLALRIAFLTIVATYSIIAFAFINFELFVAEACGGEVIKAGAKVASGAGFNKKLISSSLESKLYDKSLMVYDPVVAKCAIKASSSNMLDGLLTVVKHEPVDILKSLKFKSFYLFLQKEVKLMSEVNGNSKVTYPFLFLNEKDESVNNEFVGSLIRMKPYFGVMLKMIEDDFINNSRLLLFDTSLYLDAEFKKVGEHLKLIHPKLSETAKDRIVLIKRMCNFYFNEFSDKEATYLIGDPARMRDLDLRSNSFDLILFYENLKHRVYPETFKVAEPRPDASETVKPGKGVGDFVAKFKGDKEVTYCEGKTAHYFNSKLVVGYLMKENYSVFETNIHNYLIDKLKNITTTIDAVEDDNREVLKQEMVEHPQLIYHISKGRQVAYVFNFPDIYTKDPELLLRIEKELNGREDIIKYIPPNGVIRLACSKLDDKIIQSENLD